MKFNSNRKTKKVLKKLSEFINATSNKFHFAVMGGIAVDGYVGNLTRNHPDVDMFIFREELEKVEEVLEKLGYRYKRFTHPRKSGLEYKMQTGDKSHLFSFQILDQVGKDKFEISFYRDPHLIFPISFIKPPNWLILEGVRFPAASKKLLIELKQNELNFFEKLKKKDPEKYKIKRKDKHLNCLRDIKLLKGL